MKSAYRRLRLVLGDQLNANHSWFRERDAETLYLVAELPQETAYVRHHVQKVCAFFAAMEQFAHALQAAGHEVLYLTLDETREFTELPDLLQHLVDEYRVSEFEYQLPDEYRLRQQLAGFAAEAAVPVSACESEHFLLPDAELDDFFQPGKRHRMEAFYRKMRQRFDVLMDGAEPAGGQWNYDARNRNKLKETDFPSVPEPLLFDNDVTAIFERLERHGVATIGHAEQHLPWPVNRRQALALLDFFCRHCLAGFGRFQDAMSGRLDDLLGAKKQWSLFHSRLSFALNSKMIGPERVVRAVEAAYRERPQDIALSDAEGFIRQVLGWREFIRGIYWANMPDYATLNHLGADRDLPDWFWTGRTRMRCLQHAVGQSLDHAYAHHIQRLMVTGNFCLIAGIEPAQVDAWYLGIYIDAIEWVELPNTRGMSQFADGGIVGSKAYAASGNYVNKMSDYCGDCPYRVTQATGSDACPLNALYWGFMHRHEDAFSSNPRNRMVYANWRKKDPEQQQAILQRAEHCLANIEDL